MLENLTGTVVDGIIKLDKPLDLPNGTVVRITIQLIKPSTEALAAWESTQQRLRERPINSGGVRFTRDELHERR